MKKDPAIHALRETRHKISAKYQHDPKALIAHYQAEEEKYRGRLVRETTEPYSTRSAK